ncbi:MAG: hypothetical protein HUU20_15055 [Pirellulales bacterium]|nr:hypothetical protein [Pirellulales bacterium]
MSPATSALPTYRERLAELAAAELSGGWLAACEEAGRFLAPCRELVTALADVLHSLSAEPLLEVCAGDGELAREFTVQGLRVVATDASRSPAVAVQRLTAGEALRRYRPSVVLGSFVPFDAGVDEAVLAFPSVAHYVVLGARLCGLLGSRALWQTPGWKADPIESVNRWMLTRHDVWLGLPDQPILRHGEAWLVKRNSFRSLFPSSAVAAERNEFRFTMEDNP